MEDYRTFLDPHTLAKIKDLELVARRLIEGLVSGPHKSPFQGVSVEFAQHREYVPGDDIRHIDWKVFGKTDKFYLKQYEQETNLVCHLLVDASESMRYASKKVTKLDYAIQLAATITYLVLQQQDSVGLAVFDRAANSFLPPSGQAGYLKQILHQLVSAPPSAERSRIGACLDELAERMHRKSLVILISDCFDEVDAIGKALRHLRHKRHDIAIFQILDPAELDFPFQDITLFKGLELYPEVLTEPRQLRQAYQEEFGGFLRQLKGVCRNASADYHEVRTNAPLDRVLTNFLANRSTRRG